MLKLALLAMVKNESDIIESFVRHNLQFANEMFILDNGSTDNTFLILQHLKDEGLPIHLFQDATTGHQQQKLSTNLLHSIKNQTDADVFMFLDADEFICIHPSSPIYHQSQDERKQFFTSQLNKVVQRGLYAIKWLNFLPIDNNHDDYINHFDEFYECNQALLIHQKVIYARELLDQITLSQGNHFLYRKDTNEPIHQMVFDDIALAHFPIRSPKQAINKILNTAIAVSSRKIEKGESFHIFEMQNKIADNNYQINIDECREMARTYGIPPYYKESITHGYGKVNSAYTIQLKYLHLNNLNAIHSLRIAAENAVKKSQHLETLLEEGQLSLASKDHELKALKATLDEVSRSASKENQQLNHRLVQLQDSQAQYKRLLLIRLLKPFIKLEQGLHSLNRYRKAFRILMREKGSFGKAYQTIRRYYKAHGLKPTKAFLKDILYKQSGSTNYWIAQTDKEFNLSDGLVILTTKHTHYIAKLIANALKKIDINSSIIFEKPSAGYTDQWHIVICPQIFESLPQHYIAFQMEQSVSSRWFTEDYFNRLKNARFVFDYSLTNIEYLHNHEIPFGQLYYMPIGTLSETKSDTTVAQTSYEYDVAFYGDPNCDRRKAFLQKLQEHFNVKVISEVFGDELHNELKKAKIIVNIHYYENALLETTRLYECLSLGKLVVSEKGSDQDEHEELSGIIDFTDVDDIDAMIRRIRHWLNSPSEFDIRLKDIINFKNQTTKFDFYFYRFLLAQDLLDFDKFYELCADYIKPMGDFWCLSLPESTLRRKDFIKDNQYDIWLFTGLRHHIGWIGCGLSYKFMMKKAEELGLSQVAICEDDVLFYENFKTRYADVIDTLKNTHHEWDVFSGLIADLSDDTSISNSEITSQQEEFYVLNKLVSMVFNIYNKSSYAKIYQWSHINRSVNNTIDRYIENHGGIKGLVISPYLVGHKEDLDSTLWGFNNATYREMIENSQKLLDEKINQLKNSHKETL